jgi:hypothetical protein
VRRDLDVIDKHNSYSFEKGGRDAGMGGSASRERFGALQLRLQRFWTVAFVENLAWGRRGFSIECLELVQNVKTDGEVKGVTGLETASVAVVQANCR